MSAQNKQGPFVAALTSKIWFVMQLAGCQNLSLGSPLRRYLALMVTITVLFFWLVSVPVKLTVPVVLIVPV